MIQIENYISGFLLKNQYCAISGLGTLELVRVPSSIDDDERQVQPPEYKISYVPIGVIDDAFATYIANHENVSISKASNDIKTFSQNVKAAVKRTGRFDVEGVGYFTYENDKLQFNQSGKITIEKSPINIQKQKPQTANVEEESTIADANTFKDLNFTHAESVVSKPKTGVMLKYLLGLLLLIGVAAAIFFAYQYYQDSQATDPDNETSTDVVDFEESAVTDTTETIITDSLSAGTTDSNNTVNNPIDSANTAIPGSYQVAVMAFQNAAAAQAKADKLNNWGNKSSIKQIGDKYYVVITAKHPAGDTTILKDSLRRYFNPSGTPFIVK